MNMDLVFLHKLALNRMNKLMVEHKYVMDKLVLINKMVLNRMRVMLIELDTILDDVLDKMISLDNRVRNHSTQEN